MVFPAPVPPLTRMFSRSATAVSSIRTSGSGAIAASGTGSTRKRRTVRHGPSTASGGMIALTREPSTSRASTRGDDRSTRRPSGATIRAISASMVGVSKAIDGADQPPGTLDPDVAGSVHHHLGDRRVGQQRLERPQPARPGQDPGHHLLGVGGREQRRLCADEAGHLGPVHRPVAGRRGGQHLAVHLVLDGPEGDRVHAASGSGDATEGSVEAARQPRVASIPASTTRATAGSTAISARTGAPTTFSTSLRPRARPGSTTSTTPDGRIGAAATRRSAR